MSDPGIFGTGLKNELKNESMLKLLIFHNNIGESKKKNLIRKIPQLNVKTFQMILF